MAESSAALMFSPEVLLVPESHLVASSVIHHHLDPEIPAVQAAEAPAPELPAL